MTSADTRRGLSTRRRTAPACCGRQEAKWAGRPSRGGGGSPASGTAASLLQLPLRWPYRQQIRLTIGIAATFHHRVILPRHVGRVLPLPVRIVDAVDVGADAVDEFPGGDDGAGGDEVVDCPAHRFQGPPEVQ